VVKNVADKRNPNSTVVLARNTRSILLFVGSVISASFLSPYLTPCCWARAEPTAEKRTEIQFTNPHSAAYVNNLAKALLDDLASRLRNNLDTTAILVGFALKRERHPERLAKLRAANVKTYLSEVGVDSSRIEIRTGGIGDPKVDVYLVPPAASKDGIPGIRFKEESAWVDVSQCAQQDPTVREITVLFEQDKARFESHNEVRQLSEVAKDLREDRDLIAVVVGFPDKGQEGLGAQRALAVVRFLLSQGQVPSTQLVARVGSSGGTYSGRAVVTLIHRSAGEAVSDRNWTLFPSKRLY
jgi:outer membrane protein OmpA-like peptidoglycan-associated protein